MSQNHTHQPPPDADKLKRLLALALNKAATDGEAMNALRAARAIVEEFGGLHKALVAMKGEDPRRSPNERGYETPKEERNSNFSFDEMMRQFYGDIFNYQFRGRNRSGDPGKGFEDAKREQDRPNQERDESFRRAREKERAAREAADAIEEARERREWELRRAMGQGVPIYEALRRRRLWKPDESIDDGLKVLSDEEAAFMERLKAGAR